MTTGAPGWVHAAGGRLARFAADGLFWLLLAPLAWCMPRDRRLVVVIGREDGRFSDNAKYFCLQGWGGGPGQRRRIVFLTQDRATRDALDAGGAPAVRYPSARGIACLLRAGAVAADSVEWVRHGRFQLALGARRLQLWHGVPLKRIELDHVAERHAGAGVLRRALLGLYHAVSARQPRYDLLVSTSRAFTERAFARSFRASRIIEAGYPRNAALSAPAREALGGLVRVNTDRAAGEALRAARRGGARLVLYAPTFRLRRANVPDPGVIDWRALDEFAGRQRLCIALKLHPLLAGRTRLQAFEHIVEYDARCDVYPLLADMDALITDYSSIYFDYLLLDRPIVFFPFDLDAYRQDEHGLLFDYRAIAPGPIARTQGELHAHLGAALAPGGDAFATRRAEVRALAFDHPGPEAGLAIWNALERLLDGGAERN